MKFRNPLKSTPFFSLMAMIIVFSTACQKDNNNNAPTGSTSSDTSAAQLSAATTLADNAYDDIFQIAVQTGYDNNIAYKSGQAGDGQIQVNTTRSVETSFGVNGCAVYTVTPNDNTTFPKTIIVDFGSGCTDAVGVTRKGKITYIFSGKLITPGTTVSASFTNYSISGYQLQGTYSITNNSSLANGIAFTTKVTGGTIVLPDQRSFSYEGNKSVTQTAGITTTMDSSDDVYAITGTNTFSTTGIILVNNITKALSKAYTCKFIGSGTISFTYNNSTKGTLDFGSGTCDGDVVIKVNTYTLDYTFQ
jgi:hypothetical protein